MVRMIDAMRNDAIRVGVLHSGFLGNYLVDWKRKADHLAVVGLKYSTPPDNTTRLIGRINTTGKASLPVPADIEINCAVCGAPCIIENDLVGRVSIKMPDCPL